MESQTPAGAGKTRKLGDWIDSFLDFTGDAASPPLFRLWGGLSCIAGALERRVWIKTLQGNVYPHLYVWLVGPPTTGKGQAIEPVEALWQKAAGKTFGRLKIAPRSMTKASMIDYLKGSQRRIPLSKFPGFERSADLYEYSSIQILSEELGVFISAHDLDFLSNMTYIYNAPPIYSETRRGNQIDIEVFNPQINWLAGTQPAFLASLLPEEAWGQGTMSRIIMIYSGEAIKKKLFPSAILGRDDLKEKALKAALQADLNQMLDLYGEFKWEPEAEEAIVSWHEGGMEPAPKHSKLVHYSGRRAVHLMKLCQIVACSRGNDLSIRLADFERAKAYLLLAEEVMPDVFRDMTGKSDKQVIDELHYYMFVQYRQSKGKPIHKTALVHFLSSRIPSDKIPRLIATMEAANYIAHLAGQPDHFIPRPHSEHGVE